MLGIGFQTSNFKLLTSNFLRPLRALALDSPGGRGGWARDGLEVHRTGGNVWDKRSTLMGLVASSLSWAVGCCPFGAGGRGYGLLWSKVYFLLLGGRGYEAFALRSFKEIFQVKDCLRGD